MGFIVNPPKTTGTRPATTVSLHPHGRKRGQKVPLVQRYANLSHGRQVLAFTGRGFIPDYMSESSAVMLPEAGATHPEIEGVPGESGMMPPPGRLTRLQPGGDLDEGAGGAGSFLTATALNAKG